MNVNQELKVLLKEYNGILQLITVKTMKTGGGAQSSRIIENERKLKERGKKLCAPIGV